MKKKGNGKVKHTENSSSSTMNVLFKYLKKIITWQSLSVVAAIAMPMIIYYCQKADEINSKPDSLTLLKDSVMVNVGIIESSFNATAIAPDDYFIRFYNLNIFKEKSLELASLCSFITNAPTLMSYKSETIEDVESVLKERLNSIKHFRLLVTDIIYLMGNNDFISKVDSTYRYYFKFSKEDMLQAKIKGDKFDKRLEDDLSSFKEKYKQAQNFKSKDSIAESNPYFLECMEQLDGVMNCAEFYDCCNAVFNMIIKQNKKHIAAYNYHLEELMKEREREEREKEKRRGIGYFN